MSESNNNTQNTSTPPSAPLTEGYKGYQPTFERGYQPAIASTPSLPPQGGSVIATPPQQVVGTPSQGLSTPPLSPITPLTPPQGGSAIAAPPSTPEQK